MIGDTVFIISAQQTQQIGREYLGTHSYQQTLDNSDNNYCTSQYKSLYTIKKIQGLGELNPRHAALETAALPTELRPYGGHTNFSQRYFNASCFTHDRMCYFPPRERKYCLINTQDSSKPCFS